MKSPKRKQIAYFIVVCFLVGLGFVSGILYLKSQGHLPVRNCYDLAIAYLEMGKKYNKVDSNQDTWQKAVEQETKIYNTCIEQFPFDGQ